MFSVFCVLFQYEEVADKDDLMGVEDTAKKDILHTLFIKGCVCTASHVFLMKLKC